jgi:hypothetical protein
VLAHGILLEKPSTIEDTVQPSLVQGLSQMEGRRTYGIEKALALVARALEPLPGSKSLVLVGHGFGDYTATGVRMLPDYDEAIEALLDARVSVFSLDVTEADYHSLELGLQLVSAQTGGFYARTHLFSIQAMRRLAGSLAGHYVLMVESPAALSARPELEVKLTRASGKVLARSALP